MQQPPSLDPLRGGADEPAAVAVCLIRVENDWQTLLVKRAASLPRHAGEFSFPGGMPEAGDGGLLQTAQRETREELALDLAAGASFGGYLAPVVTTTGYVVLPCVFFLSNRPSLTPDPGESERVLWVPLATAAAAEEIKVLRGRNWPQYRLGEDLIWGASGRILQQLLRALRPARRPGEEGAAR